MMLKFAKVSHEEKYPLNVEELRMIVDNFTRYPVIRACWLAQSSSGMRIGEVLAIRKRDLVFKERIQVYIKAKGSKNLRGRTVFLSKETQEAIEVYLDDLKDDDFVFYKGVTDDEKSRAINMGRNLRVCLDRIGLDMKYEDGSYKISTHSLRAFFFTQAVRKHGENYAHRMTGHSGYLMQYDRMNEEEKLKLYIELEADLSIYDLTKANLEIERLQTLQTKENKELKDQLDELKHQLAQQGLDIVDKLKDDGKIL
jgi:integrase